MACRVTTQTGCEGGKIVNSETRLGMAHALSALVMIGTPESLQVADRIAHTAEDSRFPPDQCQEIRRAAAIRLTANGHLAPAESLLGEIAADPVGWYSLIPGLHRLGSAEAARTLLSVLETPAPDDAPRAAERALRRAKRGPRWLSPSSTGSTPIPRSTPSPVGR